MPTLEGSVYPCRGDDSRKWRIVILARKFVQFLDTPERVVLEFTPEMSIPFDGDKMAQATASAYLQYASE